MSRIIHVGDDTSRISVRHRQLVAHGRVASTPERTAPLEDLDAVVLSTLNGLELGLDALAAAVEHSTSVVVCDRRFQPVGVLLPLSGNWNHTEVLHRQIATPAARRKRSWQAIVQQKVLRQADCLGIDTSASRRLVEYAKKVRSGDTSNVEASAARLY